MSNSLGWTHLVFALLAMAAGAGVLLLPKGTRWHRTLGHAYVTAMAGMIVTALFIYDLFSGFGPFHAAALVALATVATGMWHVLARPGRRWLEHHANWMAWSYVGLLAAFVAESGTRALMPFLARRLPADLIGPAFWLVVVGGTFLTVGVGSRLVKARLPPSIEKTPDAMRRERRRLRRPEVPAEP